MVVSKLLIMAFSVYLLWAVVLSGSFFHRVWSVGLFSLLAITTALFSQPSSAYSIPLSILALLDVAMCLALSPVQRLFYSQESPDSGTRALEIVSPKLNTLGKPSGFLHSYFAESVPHLLYLVCCVNMNDSNYRF